MRFGVSPECKHLLVARFDGTPADVRGLLSDARCCALVFKMRVQSFALACHAYVFSDLRFQPAKLQTRMGNRERYGSPFVCSWRLHGGWWKACKPRFQSCPP